MHTFRAVVGDPQQWITAIEMKAGRHAEFQKTGEEEVENRWGEPLNVRFASKESIPGIKRGMKSLYQSTIEKKGLEIWAQIHHPIDLTAFPEIF